MMKRSNLINILCLVLFIAINSTDKLFAAKSQWTDDYTFDTQIARVVGAATSALDKALSAVEVASDKNGIAAALTTLNAELPDSPEAHGGVSIATMGSTSARTALLANISGIFERSLRLFELIHARSSSITLTDMKAAKVHDLVGKDNTTKGAFLRYRLREFLMIIFTDITTSPGSGDPSHLGYYERLYEHYNSVEDSFNSLYTSIEGSTGVDPALAQKAAAASAAAVMEQLNPQMQQAFSAMREYIEKRLGSGGIGIAGSGLDYKHVGAVDATRAQQNTEAVATFAHELKGAGTAPRDFVAAVGKIATLETDVAGLKAGKADKTDLAAEVAKLATKAELAAKADAATAVTKTDAAAEIAKLATKTELAAKADAATAATKTELAAKADAATAATKTELAAKADVVTAATKTELAAEVAKLATKVELATKADVATAATKAEVDAAVGKDDSAGLRKRVKDIEDAAVANRAKMQQLLGDDTVVGSIAQQLKAIRDLL